MKTDVQKPNDIFYATTRLVVPLFQRPYVWSEEQQWAPLWEDIVRLIDIIEHHNPAATHFLGAIVIQQVPTPLGGIQTWNVIDGQQRLTTLQILLSSLYRQLVARDEDQLSGQIHRLISNPSDEWQVPEDEFKLWPTNRDRSGFVAAMTGIPTDTDPEATTLLEQAHDYFSAAISTWLGDDHQVARQRARALVAVVRERLEIATIRLDATEDAQAIFETLNARGTPLSAADLIKNFVFQNLGQDQENAEEYYRKYWAQFETSWWEEEITTGRVKNSRSSLFLWQWLTSQTLEEFPLREVFRQFKYYVSTADKGVSDLLPRIRSSADRYRDIIDGATRENGPLTRTELFSYRLRLLDSEVARPLVIWLDEPEQAGIPQADKERVLTVLEGWLVRRMLAKVPSQGANRYILDIIKYLGNQPKDNLPAALSGYLTSNNSTVGYWPSDGEVRRELTGARAYTRYVRARLRMVLEALEDARRGYPDGAQLAMGPIARGKGTVEHLMPQKWRKHWADDLTEDGEIARDSILHQLGNLTLVTQKLNSKINNGPWSAKREFFRKHDDVLITRDVLGPEAEVWSEASIERRTNALIDEILAIWPIPEGYSVSEHRGDAVSAPAQAASLAELVATGKVPAGTVLRGIRPTRQGKDVTAMVTDDGRISVDGTAYASPSAAAKEAAGTRSENGWTFWMVEDSGRTLDEVRADHIVEHE